MHAWLRLGGLGLLAGALLVACGQNLTDGSAPIGDVAAPMAAGLDPDRLARVDTWLEEQIDAGAIAGAQVMIARHDRIVHDVVFGVRDLATGSPVRPDTLWRIYSMTKPVTSVATLMLYEEGAFALDDPVAEHLPEFAEMWILDGEERVPARGPITIRHLLTHTAGLSYGFTDQGVDALYRESGVFESPDLATFSRRVAELPLAFEPGRRWHYSVATDILGRLVEVVSGQSLDRFLHDRLFDPLGMVDTAFEVPAEKLDRFGTNHRIDPENGGLVIVPDGSLAGIRWQNVTLLSGGGGLVSTAADYMRFARMLLNGGALDGVRILSPKTVDWMTRNHLPADADGGRPVYGRGDGVGFGLGFAVVEDAARWAGVVAAPGEYWWGGAAGTYFWIDPEHELIAILMIQRFNAEPIRRTVRALVNAAVE